MSDSRERDPFTEWQFGMFITVVTFVSFGIGMFLFTSLNIQYRAIGGILGAAVGFLLISYLTALG